ncbi:hypothetical protein GLYMA_09G197600v4 [Glycine max]|uniref:Uncharacterized protein n=2 Tax=Glycine subgen. Soja TaxID=1462606 RepID=K7LEX3_SOYBN|nr:hypothetical protein GLYMA_09G197600v4 [Glycine max]RZB92902.1 hypothetical protein D0Y65_024697 [Glycine soja]
MSCEGLPEGEEGKGGGGNKATDGWENRFGEGGEEEKERKKKNSIAVGNHLRRRLIEKIQEGSINMVEKVNDKRGETRLI